MATTHRARVVITAIAVVSGVAIACGEDQAGTLGNVDGDDAPDLATLDSTASDAVASDSAASEVTSGDAPDVTADATSDDTSPMDTNGPSDGDEVTDDIALDASDVPSTTSSDVAGDSADAEPTIAERCFPGIDPATVGGPSYDALNPVVGSHCMGTNHQDITGVEEVVFFGDSVTVGTPNLTHLLSIDNAHFYRNLLAEWLADHFGLDKGDAITWGLWKAYDYFSGKGSLKQAGAFRDCAKWGARTDDFIEGGGQFADCFPDGGSTKKTLVVFTMGGNDIAAITKKGAEASEAEVAAGYPEARALAAETSAYLDDAIAWLKDPARFPNGSYVVFANPFEFTDGTGQTDACSPQNKLDIPGIGEIDLSQFDIPVASLAGIGEWADPAQQKEIVVGLLEDYMRVAVARQADLVFMLERFCGHGYVATGADADPQNACYQGADAALWFDETCIHPSVAGHEAIFEMFRAVISE